ncbi:hypothetical protein [Pseudobacillus badius]|uniref:hypothetical protein n=1 Tax=Bacillus badius TaxID=1455 RepID=UPI0009EF4B0E|nr:hypothetical protein [Bacillus badius]
MFGKNTDKNQGGMGTNLSYMLLGAGAAAWWLSKEENRDKLEGWMNTAKEKMNIDVQPSKEEFPVLKAGHPHPDDIADNKMVAEGSQFGVHYYNEKEQQ